MKHSKVVPREVNSLSARESRRELRTGEETGLSKVGPSTRNSSVSLNFSPIHTNRSLSVKSRDRKKLPALKRSRDVSHIMDKAEKEIERKEKDFIIQIISSTVPLEPIHRVKNGKETDKKSRGKSKKKLADDLLEIKLTKSNSLEEGSLNKDEANQLKRMHSLSAASLLNRYKEPNLEPSSANFSPVTRVELNSSKKLGHPRTLRLSRFNRSLENVHQPSRLSKQKGHRRKPEYEQTIVRPTAIDSNSLERDVRISMSSEDISRQKDGFKESINFKNDVLNNIPIQTSSPFRHQSLTQSKGKIKKISKDSVIKMNEPQKDKMNNEEEEERSEQRLRRRIQTEPLRTKVSRLEEVKVKKENISYKPFEETNKNKSSTQLSSQKLGITENNKAQKIESSKTVAGKPKEPSQAKTIVNKDPNFQNIKEQEINNQRSYSSFQSDSENAKELALKENILREIESTEQSNFVLNSAPTPKITKNNHGPQQKSPKKQNLNEETKDTSTESNVQDVSENQIVSKKCNISQENETFTEINIQKTSRCRKNKESPSKVKTENENTNKKKTDEDSSKMKQTILPPQTEKDFGQNETSGISAPQEEEEIKDQIKEEDDPKNKQKSKPTKMKEGIWRTKDTKKFHPQETFPEGHNSQRTNYAQEICVTNFSVVNQNNVSNKLAEPSEGGRSQGELSEGPRGGSSPPPLSPSPSDVNHTDGNGNCSTLKNGNQNIFPISRSRSINTQKETDEEGSGREKASFPHNRGGNKTRKHSLSLERNGGHWESGSFNQDDISQTEIVLDGNVLSVNDGKAATFHGKSNENQELIGREEKKGDAEERILDKNITSKTEERETNGTELANNYGTGCKQDEEHYRNSVESSKNVPNLTDSLTSLQKGSKRANEKPTSDSNNSKLPDPKKSHSVKKVTSKKFEPPKKSLELKVKKNTIYSSTSASSSDINKDDVSIAEKFNGIEAIYLNVPLEFEEPIGCTVPRPQSVSYHIENETLQSSVKTERAVDAVGKTRVLLPSSEERKDDFSLSSLSSNEEELAYTLQKFIEEEGFGYDLCQRYEEFIKSKQRVYQDKTSENSSRKDSEQEALELLLKDLNKIILPNCPEKGHQDLENCSICEEMNCVQNPEMLQNQSYSELRKELANGEESHVENISSSQSGLKEATSTAESIQKPDPKSLLTVERNSNPQVTARKSHLTGTPLPTQRGGSKKPFKKRSVIKGKELKPISTKEEVLVHSAPNQAEAERNRRSFTTREERSKSWNNVSSELSQPAKTKIPIRAGSDMLTRLGYTNTSNQENRRFLPPIVRRGEQNFNPLKHWKTSKMVFDFLNPFKRNRSRGYRGRVPISVKPNPIRMQKGYEYEDLPGKRSNYHEKRRNSAGKIYIRDPNNMNSILVAEEIGYVYGDPRQHVKQIKPPKVTTGMQTVPVKEPKLRPGETKARSILSKKRNNYLPAKITARKNGKIITQEPIDIQTASTLETPREKGDYVIFASKNLTKAKTKSVTFKEAERGIPSISSTLGTSAKERLYGNQRDAATDPRTFPPPYGYPGFQPAPLKSAQGMYQNGGIVGNGFGRMQNPVLQRRASFDGPLPPVRARPGDGTRGEYFGQIHHASSHPNLSQNSSGAVLLPPEDYPQSPLRYDDREPLQPKKGAKKGWARVKEMTMKPKGDTVIDGFGSDLTLGTPGRKVPGTNVPIVLLQGFFKNSRGGGNDPRHRGPTQKKEKLMLPKSLMEPNSMLRGALPILPTYLATFCLTLNIFVPGLGTLMSGWFGACVGRNRLGTGEVGDQKYLSILVTGVTGAVQMFTVTFFLVGWFWSVSWGILLVSIARKYKKFVASQRSSMNRNIGFELLTANTN